MMKLHVESQRIVEARQVRFSPDMDNRASAGEIRDMSVQKKLVIPRKETAGGFRPIRVAVSKSVETFMSLTAFDKQQLKP